MSNERKGNGQVPREEPEQEAYKTHGISQRDVGELHDQRLRFHFP